MSSPIPPPPSSQQFLPDVSVTTETPKPTATVTTNEFDLVHDETWKRANSTLPPGQLMKAAVDAYNTKNNLSSDQAWNISDRTEVSVESLDEKGDVDKGGISVEEIKGKAFLNLQYSLTLTNKKGETVKILIPQRWETDAKIPVPGTLKEELFQTEIQTIFYTLSQKITSKLIALPKPGEAEVSAKARAIADKKLDRLCKMTGFNWERHTLSQSGITSVEERLFAHLPIGSLATLSSRKAITALKTHGMSQAISALKHDRTFNRKINCPSIEKNRERMKGVETAAADMLKNAMTVKNKQKEVREALVQEAAAVSEEVSKAEQEKLEADAALTDAENTLQEAIQETVKTHDGKRQLLDTEITKAGDILSEIAGLGLHWDEKHNIQMKDVKQPLDNEIKRGMEAAEEVKKAETKISGFEAKILELQTKIQDMHPGELQDLTLLKNIHYLEAREGALFGLAPYQSKEETKEKRQIEGIEIEYRKELLKLQTDLAEIKRTRDSKNNIAESTKEKCTKTADTIEKEYNDLHACLTVIKALCEMNESGDLKGLPGISQESKERLSTLNSILRTQKYHEGDLGYQVQKFREKIDTTFPGRQATVAGSTAPTPLPEQDPIPLVDHTNLKVYIPKKAKT